MADSFSFNGIDLSGSTYGVTVVDGPQEFLPNPRISTLARPNAHGAILRGEFLQEKHLVIPVVIEGSNHADLLAKCQALRGVFHPREGEKQIILDYQDDRTIKGRLESGLGAVPVGCRAIETELKFICGDPTWYGTMLRRGEVTTPATSMNIAYAGSEYTPLIMTYRQGTGGLSAYNSCSVRNGAMYSTAVGSCEVNPYRLSAGQYIRFDSMREIVEVSMDEVTWVPVMQYLVLSDGLGVRAGFPQLKPGVTNSITRVGVSDWTGGFERYEYYDRYL